MYPKAGIKDLTLKKTYGQKTEGAGGLKMKSTPANSCRVQPAPRLPRRIFASIRRSDSLSRPPSGKPSGEEEQQRVDKVTITRHARTHP